MSIEAAAGENMPWISSNSTESGAHVEVFLTCGLGVIARAADFAATADHLTA